MQLRRPPLLERIPLSGPASVAVREFRTAGFRHPWHQHPEVELTWILKGSGLRYVGDSVQPFHAGDFCLVGGNLPHTWLSPEGETGLVRSLVVQFDPARWGTALMELPEFARIADLFERASRGLAFDSTLAARARTIMLRRASPFGRFTALLEILEELAEHPGTRPLAFAPWAPNRRLNSDPRLRVIQAFLSKNAGGPVAQKDAARLVRLSPAAFSRFFRRAVGKTFGAYLTDLRLSDACRRLLESDHTISQIAFDAGFDNLSTFNRSFRKARGMSPRAFRRQALGHG
ncbi:MAG: helix-turn-helix domain-containing protein [Terrimicrobiaceae bacterium]|nr:helix-turn-helix domain-containing protein [Terrimicrobiaceae bacterium]